MQHRHLFVDRDEAGGGWCHDLDAVAHARAYLQHVARDQLGGLVVGKD